MKGTRPKDQAFPDASIWDGHIAGYDEEKYQVDKAEMTDRMGSMLAALQSGDIPEELQGRMAKALKNTPEEMKESIVTALHQIMKDNGGEEDEECSIS